MLLLALNSVGKEGAASAGRWKDEASPEMRDRGQGQLAEGGHREGGVNGWVDERVWKHRIIQLGKYP